MTPSITLILAHDESGAIGAGSGLPWPRIPEDMKRFRDETLGRPVVMGRKTMETLSRPLPWRHNIVLTRDRSWRMDKVTAVCSIDAAVAAGDGKEMMVIGGAEIYSLFLPLANRILLTRIRGSYAGDVFWNPDLSGWQEKRREEVKREGAHICDFLTYERTS